MFGSSIIDVATGIVFVFLLMSLIASTVNEIIFSFLNMRGKELLRGIQTLLNDGEAKKLVVEADGLVKDLYNHGHIFGLFQGPFDGKNQAGDLPSYIPARNFALALLDTVPKKAAIQKLKDAIAKLDSQDAKETLNSKLPSQAAGQSAAPEKQAPLAKPVTDVIRDIQEAASQVLKSPTLTDVEKAKVQDIVNIATVALGEDLSTELRTKLSAVAEEARRLSGGAGAALASMADGVTATNVVDLLGKMEEAAKKLNGISPNLTLLVDAAKSEADPIQKLRKAALAIDPKVGQPLTAMIKEASGDVTQLIAEVEAWYNSAMDRVSGWYKYHTQKLLFGLGVLLAVTLNANTIIIVQALSKNATLRQSVVAAAQQYVSANSAKAAGNAGVNPPAENNAPGPSAGTNTTPESTSTEAKTQGPATAPSGNGSSNGTSKGAAGDNSTDTAKDLQNQIQGVHDQVDSLEGFGLPLGWSNTWRPTLTYEKTDNAPQVPKYGTFVLAWLGVLAGWLITAFAVSLGAPFWFDILNKIMVVRSTVKPQEKSQEEASKS
jgi:hypothetical protein